MSRFFDLSVLLSLIMLITSSCFPAIDRATENIFGGEPSESQPENSTDVELTPNILTALQSGPLVDESLGSCITSDFSLRPQPFRVEGAPFRVEGAPFRVEGAPFRVEGADGILKTEADSALQPSFVSTYFQTQLNPSFTQDLDSDAGILVLDNFGPNIFNLDKTIFEVEELLPETLVEFEIEGFTSHGALVMNHINGILDGFGTYTPERTAPDAVSWQHDSGSRIVVKAVAPRDFNTETVAEALQTSLAEMRADGIENIVVNMSFIILPCSIVKDFAVKKILLPSFFEYYRQAVEDNVNTIMRRQGIPFFLRDRVAEEVADLIVDELKPVDPEGDPLRLLMLAEPDVLFVGAAGNFGRGVTAYPAVWDEVLSVSASDPEEKADFSNTGSVMLAGAWFRLINPLNLNGHDLPAANVVYAGTSFAAPGVSVFAALDLATGARCGLIEGQPKLSLSNEQNVRLERAVAQRCL